MAVDITALYCCLDDFCKVFEEWEAHRLIPSGQTRKRSGKLSRSEMLFIMVLFHLSPYKNFKTFYLYGIGVQHRGGFRDLPHYDRFITLMPRLFAPLMVLLHSLSGEETGIYFVDSTKLAVCHNRRIHRHKVFDGLAARGKTSMGWFYGLKLHFVINHKGQIMALKITPGNTADPAGLDEIPQHLTGKAYLDKVTLTGMFASEFDADGCSHRMRTRHGEAARGGHGATSPLRLTSDTHAESIGPQAIRDWEGRSERVNSSGERMCR